MYLIFFEASPLAEAKNGSPRRLPCGTTAADTVLHVFVMVGMAPFCLSATLLHLLEAGADPIISTSESVFFTTLPAAVKRTGDILFLSEFALARVLAAPTALSPNMLRRGVEVPAEFTEYGRENSSSSDALPFICCEMAGLAKTSMLSGG